MSERKTPRINPYRIQVYPRKELWQRIKELADQRGDGVSATTNALLERALFGGEPAQIAAALEPHFADIRADLAFVLGRVFLVEALADRALLASSAAYAVSRRGMEETLGEERYDAIFDELNNTVSEAYERQKATALDMAKKAVRDFTGGENGNKE